MGKERDTLVGIDLGGTKIHAVVVDRRRRICGTARLATGADQGYQAVLARVAEAAGAAVADAGLKWKRIAGVGLGVPGPVDEAKGVILMAPNLGWEPSPVGPDLGKLLGLPVAVGNDVNLGALGEAAAGCARGVPTAFMAFVGTGLGGAFVRKGRVVNGAHGFGGEIGHLPAPFGDGVCGCGRRGCLETTASKSGIARLLREAAARGQRPRLPASGGLRSSAIRAALAEGCPATTAAVARCAEAVAWGLTVAAHVVDPHCFVLGGGVAEGLGAPFLEQVRGHLAGGSALYSRQAPDLRLAQLGDDAVALGAAVAAEGR